METRQQFISRMMWMVSEIRTSGHDDSNILSMLDFQLKQFQCDFLMDVNIKVNNAMRSKESHGVSNKFIIRTGSDKFIEIIDEL